MLQTNLKRLRDALVGISADIKVYHYWRPNMKAPFILWQEDGEDDSLQANNHKVQQGIQGTVDYYTKTEYDEVFDQIQSSLNELENYSWRYDGTVYEEESNLIHHTWEWWLRDGEI